MVLDGNSTVILFELVDFLPWSIVRIRIWYNLERQNDEY